MTAHREKPTITSERIAWFRAYHQQHPEWGVFHVALADGNFRCGAAMHMWRSGTGDNFDGKFVSAQYDFSRDEWDADVKEAADWFDTLTPSQRNRLRKRVEFER